MSVRKSSVRPALFSVFSCSQSISKLRAIAMMGALLGVLFTAGQAHAAATTYTVNATTDTGTGSGTTGDLRYALTQAEQAANSGSTINITATGTITLTSALPDIGQDTTIVGPGATQLTISGASAYRVFRITAGTVSISGLTIADGMSSGNYGAGIQSVGTLTVSDCVFTGGSAGFGGGISNGGTLIVSGSAFLRNAASGSGGVIYATVGTVNVTNSTFYANSSGLNGGAIYQATGTLTVANSTFYGNTAVQVGGALSTNTSVTLDVVNNVFAAGSAPSDGGISTGATTIAEGNNLFFNNSNGDASFTLSGTDVTGQDPKLLPLGNYGGSTLTMLPQPASPAICAGSVSDAKDASGATLTTDQRGFALNAANCSNGGVDAGAVQTNYLMVTTATDSAPSSCTSAACSLRDAINAANTAGGDISFKSGLGTLTISPTQGALPAITGAVNIIGPGANQLTVSGGSSTTVGSVFTVNSGAVATLYGLTIANGNVNGDGGGINNSGTLSVIDSAVSGNTANTGNVGGGGIYSSGTLAVLDSTISGNSATSTTPNPLYGGGIASNGGNGITVTGSTISGNTITAVSALGGGIGDVSGTLVVTDSTISGNTASSGGSGGGIYPGASGIILANSIVAGNTAQTNADVAATYTDKGGNLVGTSGINLAPLGTYGGPTQTMLPLPGSPALCAGSSSLAQDANGNALTTDQRGFTVGAASYCTSGKIDAGAVQTNYTSAQFTNSGFSALVNQVVTPAPILSVMENGQNTGGIPITLTFTGSGTATGLGPATTVAGTGATFSSIKVDTAGAGDSLSVSLPVGTSNLTASGALEIDGPVTLSPATGALTASSVGASYSQAVTASGGKSPYSYARGTGAFPDGVTLDTSTGVLSGTPTKAGNFTFSIQATDKKSNTGSASYTLAISQAATLIGVTSKDTTTTSEPSGASFVGDSVTFTASLTPVGKGVTFAKGVAFTLDGTAVAACSSQAVTVAADGSSATATCVITTLTKGSRTISASYAGDSNYGAGSGNLSQTVNLTGTSVALASSDSTSNVDDSVKFTATITSSGSGTPSGGTVDFTSDGASIGCDAVSLTVASGKATAQCSTSSLVAGSHSIVAAYSGDGSAFDTSTSSAFSQTVSKATTAVKVTSTGATGVNQQVTLTATMTPNSPVALSGGTMAFKDGAAAISGCGTQAVAANGQAQCTASFSTAASHTISATYSGDSNYSATAAGSVTTLSQVVNQANTSLSLASVDTTTTGLGLNVSNLNDSVTFTATVTPFSGATALTPPFTGIAAPSGIVNFVYNGKTICSAVSATLNAGTGTYQAACTTAALPAGPGTMSATYSNDSNYNGSNDSTTQTVNSAATSISVATSGPSTVNQTVTFTASVTPFTAATKLSGSVTFTYVNTTTSAAGTLCNAVGVTASTGQASCSVSSLTPGSYTITASYGSDSNYNASTGTVAQTVGQATSGITLSSTPNPSTTNAQVTLTAMVTAPSGTTALNGSVSFTDNGNAIADCPATTINPNAPTVVCKTSSLALGTHALVANYGGDANFSNSSSTPVTQTVNPAPTSLSISSSASGNTSVVDQNVSFTAAVSGASGATQFTGTMTFTDNGNAIAGCSALKAGATTGSATCSTSMLLRGSHTITATYAGDSNFSTSGNSLTQTINPGASSITLVSSPNPSVALNPNGYNDQVGLTATVGPGNGVPLSGAVTFTDNGAPIAECQAAVPVNPSTGIASCITSSLGFGSHTIHAAYNGDNNFTASSSSVTQSVQDYSLAASASSTVTVSQRFTNTTDPFSPEPITVSASPVAGFTGQLALTCNVVAVSAPEGAVAPACILGSSSMTIAASAQQQPVTVTIDAGTGSTPVASTGTYNVSITGVDSATGLTRTSAAFVVNVRYQAAPLTIVSGATTGNTTTVQFTLPPNVGITSIECASVTGPTLTSSVAPVALSMGCSFDPSTIAAASTSQVVTVTVTVSTSLKTSALLRNNKTTVAMAGAIGVPLLLLLGLMPGGKSSRKALLRFMVIAFAIVVVLQGTGCGGGQFTAPPSVSGQTPPGSYNILVQGTGTDHQLYQAVIQVNVTR
ncbi:MAG: beta strand repeat-containing protein [Acidobacteriaceae bacterium]